MKTKRKKFLIPIDILNIDVLFYIGYHADTANNDIDRYKEPIRQEFMKLYQNGKGQILQFENGAIVVWVKIYDDTNTLVHEITHAVQYILRNLRMDLCEKNEELYAYLTEYLYKQAIKKLK